MGLVCPLVGSYPGSAANGLSRFDPSPNRRGGRGIYILDAADWVFSAIWDESERSVGMVGSLVFTFLGMGLSAIWNSEEKV